MLILCKKLRPEAIIPTQAYEFDAGWDLYTPEDIVLDIRHTCHTAMLGLALDIPPGYCAVFKGRSGLARDKGLDVLGGVVDAGYRGEVGVTLLAAAPVSFKAGDKIAQMLILPVPKVEMLDVGDEGLSKSKRSMAGFGSSDARGVTSERISCAAQENQAATSSRPVNAPPDGAGRIVAERQRQIEQEGWTPAHDDAHARGQLLDAGLCYVYAAINTDHPAMRTPPREWPWEAAWWKPSGDLVRDLTKAGALFAAEIDRVERLRNQDRPDLLQVPSPTRTGNIVAEPEIEQAHGPADEEI